MNQARLGSWIAVTLGTLYFVVPLIGTFEFSLRMRRGEYSFDAYRVVFGDPNFQATFLYSTLQALATIVVGVLLLVAREWLSRLGVAFALLALALAVTWTAARLTRGEGKSG